MKDAEKPELTVVDGPLIDDRLVVRLTLEEAQVLVNMIDIAIRARGLEAAAAGFELAKRIQEAKPPESG